MPNVPQPQRGCICGWICLAPCPAGREGRVGGCNPVGVGGFCGDTPRVARHAQPWAGRFNLVEIGSQDQHSVPPWKACQVQYFAPSARALGVSGGMYPRPYPKGITSSSPGLIGSIYPGFGCQMSPNPKGVASAGGIAWHGSTGGPVENRRYMSPRPFGTGGGSETRGPRWADSPTGKSAVRGAGHRPTVRCKVAGVRQGRGRRRTPSTRNFTTRQAWRGSFRSRKPQ